MTAAEHAKMAVGRCTHASQWLDTSLVACERCVAAEIQKAVEGAAQIAIDAGCDYDPRSAAAHCGATYHGPRCPQTVAAAIRARAAQDTAPSTRGGQREKVDGGR
jgi:hypothetical protein